YTYIFFYSCSSRHTRSPRDWSSDVCSSDLPLRRVHGRRLRRIRRDPRPRPRLSFATITCDAPDRLARRIPQVVPPVAPLGSILRSEECRVGKECRSRWWTVYLIRDSKI